MARNVIKSAHSLTCSNDCSVFSIELLNLRHFGSDWSCFSWAARADEGAECEGRRVGSEDRTGVELSVAGEGAAGEEGDGLENELGIIGADVLAAWASDVGGGWRGGLWPRGSPGLSCLGVPELGPRAG